MKALLASTALALAFSAPAFAQNANINEDSFQPTFEENQYRGTDLIGATLWQTEKAVEGEMSNIDPEEQEWEMVGEINDVIIGADGQVDQVIAAVGGFLGLGQKEISVKMDALTFISDGEAADEWFIVFNGPASMIEDAPNYGDEQQAWNDERMSETEGEETADASTMETESDTETETAAAAGAAGAMTESETETETADASTMETEGETETETADASTMTTEGETETADASTMQTEGETESAELRNVDEDTTTPGMTSVVASESGITADELTGAAVYAEGSDHVGEVGELILSADGQTIEQAIIDVGGFLGLGEKPVAVSLDQLTIESTEGGDISRVLIDMPREDLENAEPYGG